MVDWDSSINLQPEKGPEPSNCPPKQLQNVRRLWLVFISSAEEDFIFPLGYAVIS